MSAKRQAASPSPSATAIAFPDKPATHLPDSCLGLLPRRQHLVKATTSSVADDQGGRRRYPIEMLSRNAPKAYLYIKEWMEAKKVSDDELANRLRVSRAQVWKWCNQQHRLNPQKIADVARALGIKPEELWHPPTEPNLNAIIADAPADLRATAVDIVRRLVGQR